MDVQTSIAYEDNRVNNQPSSEWISVGIETSTLKTRDGVCMCGTADVWHTPRSRCTQWRSGYTVEGYQKSVPINYGEKKRDFFFPSNNYWELLYRHFRTWLSEKTIVPVLGRQTNHFTWSDVCEHHVWQVPVDNERKKGSQKGWECQNKPFSQNRQGRELPSL